MKTKSPLSIHAVGAREGVNFPYLEKFDHEFVNVFYDADADCLEQLKQIYKTRSAKLHVLPYCLSDKCGTSTININYDPFTSSLLDANSKYSQFYFSQAKRLDYVLEETTRSMEKRRVETVSMDHLYKIEKLDVPPPDFIMIDIQGAEFEFFEGAKDCIRTDTLGILTEVEFFPMYEGQKLFGDLTASLLSKGMQFVNFRTLHDPLSPHRAPIGLRGSGFLMSGDALYLRDISDLEKQITDKSLLYIKLRKLAFFAILFNQIEYSLMALAKSREVRALLNDSVEVPSYEAFLKDFEAAAKVMPEYYLPTFTESYTFQSSKDRFSGSEVTFPVEFVNKHKDKIKDKYPLLFALLRKMKRIPRRVRLVVEALQEFGNPLRRLATPTPVERVLRQYGFYEQARLLKKNRLALMPHRFVAKKGIEK